MTETSRARPRLPLFYLAYRSYTLTFRGAEAVLRFCWLGALLLALAQSLLIGEPLEAGGDGATAAVPSDAAPALVVLAFGAAMLHAMVAVAWHRAILLGETLSHKRFYLRFGAREGLYGAVAVFFFLSFFMGLGAAPLAMGADAGGPLARAIAFLGGPVLAVAVLARSMLVLPSIALGMGPDLAMSWRVTHGNGWRAIVALILVLGPLALAEFATIHAVQALFERGLDPVAGFVVRFVAAIVTILTASVVVAFVSLVYFWLVADDPAARPDGVSR